MIRVVFRRRDAIGTARTIWRVPTSAKRPHCPDSAHDVIERSARRHGIGAPQQCFEVAGTTDFMILEQRAEVAR
jgi:hypothetical protein